MKNLGVENVHFEQLQFGDYAFNGAEYDGRSPSIGIELATVADLIGKINSGRLRFQVTGLLDRYDVAILLVQGRIEPDKHGQVKVHERVPVGIPYNRIAEILFSASMHGIHVFTEPTPNAVMERLVHWYRWWQKPADSHTFFRKVDAEIQANGAKSDDQFLVPTAPALDRATASLMAMVRGLGSKRAQAALRHWGRLDVLFTLSEDQLLEIDGWGPNPVSEFRTAITSNWMKRN
jgi:ERCC4-type nuclease